MKKNLTSQLGATLVETLLVFAIIGAFIVLGLRQYSMYRHSAEMEQLKQNINIIFQAMSNYYYSNCRDNAPQGVFSYGAVISAHNSGNVSVKTVTLQDLNDEGYIDDKQMKQLSLPAITGAPDSPDDVYHLQYVPYLITTGRLDSSGNNNIIMSVWLIQVGVSFKSEITDDAASLEAYAASLGADCLVSLSGGKLSLCSTAASSGATGNIPSWTRSPSMPNPIVDVQTNWQASRNVNVFTNVTAIDSACGAPPGNAQAGGQGGGGQGGGGQGGGGQGGGGQGGGGQGGGQGGFGP